MKTIDFDLFDKWLNEELFINLKRKRKNIINLYKDLVAQNQTINKFEKELENLGWDEITIKHISDYVMIWNVKQEENAKLIRKEKDYKYIKKFMGISLNKICTELKINYSNLVKGKASIQNTRLVKERLEEEIKKLEE
jgi:hypothetical protein